MAVPPMTPPSTLSTIAFLSVVAFVVVSVLVMVRRAAPEACRRRWTVLATVAMGVWLAIGLGISASEALEGTLPVPVPPVLPFFGLTMLAAALVALSPIGRRLAAVTPVAALIGVQAFRLPLELVLHQWHREGVIPEQMTFAGYNFDIVTGVVALAAGWWLWRRGPSRGLVIATNTIGLLLLAAVATIAALSTPTPLRQFMNDPPLLLPYNPPFVLIATVCVAGALFFHVLTFRALRAQADDLVQSPAG